MDEVRCLLWGAGGLLGMGLSLYLLLRQWVFTRKGIRAKGKIIRQSTQFVGGGWASFPVVQFTDLRGRSVVVRSNFGSGYRPKKGQPMDVCYDPENPKNAILGSLLLNWMARSIPGCLGAPMVIYASMWFKVIHGH